MASLEYLAGYFDGEGCVTVQVVSPTRSPHLRISIQSADAEVLDLFALEFGGKVHSRVGNHSIKRKLYAWYLGGEKAQAALRKMVPFLVCKRRVAELGLEFTFGHTSGKTLPKEEVDKRFRLKEAISSINQRITNENYVQ